MKFRIVVAIPNTPSNDFLEKYLQARGFNVFRGYENDVLSRLYDCSIKFRINPIIRICADTVLIDPNDVAHHYRRFLEKKKFVYGDGCWIFTREMLEPYQFGSWHAEDREHVVRPLFNSIDFEDDIKRVEKIYLRSQNEN